MIKPITKKQFIINGIRKLSYRWPPRSQCLKEARISRGLYLCNGCKGEHRSKFVVADHVHPVVSVEEGFTTWDNYIERMLPDIKGWQCLCKTCHDAKSKEENALRRNNKKKLDSDDELE